MTSRIRRIRRRYQGGAVQLSVQRARFYTESWRETAGQPPAVRVALATRNVYRKMTHHLDTDDRIAGAWTEFFQGMPIDVERGVFNEVLEAELSRRTMVSMRARNTARSLAYILRSGSAVEFVRNHKRAGDAGAAPVNLRIETMPDREINPFQIDRRDRRELLGELLPYWKGRSVVDRLEQQLLRSDLYSEGMHRFVTAMSGNTSRQVALLSTCASIATYQGHVVLDYERVLRLGLTAMRQEVRTALESSEGDADRRDFLRALEISLDGVMVFGRRLALRVERELDRTVDPVRRDELARMLDTCRAVPCGPAATFEQAVQSLWTVKTAVELALPVNLQCPGRLDQLLIPYYRRDLEQGWITRAWARELLEELLLKNMTQNIRPESNFLGHFYHRYLGSSPITIGGQRPDGRDGTNELTYLIIEAADRAKAVCNISVRIHPGSPDALLREVARSLHGGTSVYALCNDETNIAAMRRRGFAEEDARDYAIMGCVEATCPGKTGSMSANALQLCRLLDITLRNGDCKVLAGTIRGEGPRTGEADSFDSFEAFLSAFHEQGRYFLDKIVRGSNLRDRLYAQHLPAPAISAFIDGCLRRGKDVTEGGGTYDLSGISMICSVANLVDSLHVIEKLVFEQRRFTLGQLVEAMDANFVGHEAILGAIRALEGKWGNGDPEVDRLAHDVTKGLFDATYGLRSTKDGPFVVYVISMITHTIDGRLSIASADGRRAAMPFAASCNPYNVERSGVTAVMRSVSALPHEDVMGCAVNVKFHPSAIGDSEEARDKWASLVRTYFKLGGSQLQPTVASAELLRQARARPEEHGDLIVKVGGYSTYFVDLGREIQDEVIARTEHAASG